MVALKGSFNAFSVVQNPEIIRDLEQNSIIIYSKKVNNIGIAINIFLAENWSVKQCWADSALNHFVLLIKE